MDSDFFMVLCNIPDLYSSNFQNLTLMKKLSLTFFVAALMVFTLELAAQSRMDKLIEKYAGQDGFTTMSINKELIQTFMQMAPPESADSSVTELRKMMEQITAVKIINFKFDSATIVKAVSVYNDLAGLFPAPGFKELMTINEGRKNVRFLSQQESNGKISEVVMLMKDKTEVMALSVTGNIDLATIGKLGKGMKIKGMEGLERLQEQHHK